MPLDLRHVESFVTVAETRSFSSAADRLNTVQSAVSTHIRLLEQHLGRVLLQRGRGRPVSLTAEGAAFLVQARRLLALSDEMERPDGQTTVAPPLRLGATITFALSVLPQALSGADQGDLVTVRTARSHDMLDLLETGRIDMALVLDQGPHDMRRATVTVPLAWVGTRAAVGQLDQLPPLGFLEDARDLRRHAFRSLDAAGQGAPGLRTFPDPIGLRVAVSAGHVITVMPRPALSEPLQDIGNRLTLPELGAVAVSIYAAASADAAQVSALTQGLLRHLDVG